MVKKIALQKMKRLSHTTSQKPTIVLTNPLLPKIVEDHLAPHANLIYVKTREELLKKISHADALICTLGVPVDEKLLRKALKLKVIGNFAVGFNNIDLEACALRGIRVVNTPDVLTRSTAELAATLLMAAARRVPEGEKLCRSGKFKGLGPLDLLGLELRGRHAVIAGAGRIGSETAKIFEGLGLTIETITRRDTDSTILEKLARAQVLSLNFPLNPSTRHWLNKKRLAALPRDAIVVNTSRGPTIDETVLIQVLKSGKIFAAGLDVYEREPEIPARLRALPNVVLLPHVGSATLTARSAMAHLVVSGVLGILSGQEVPNEVKLLR